MRKIVIAAGVVGAAAALAACGGGTGGGSMGGTGTSGAAGTVSVRTVNPVGTTLVDPSGHTLYVADQEKGGMVRCTDACASIWAPLTVGAGTTPKAPGGVSGTLGTVSRTDGTTQVTWNGEPLYTLVGEQPGKASGNGLTDNFGGTTFDWHAATTSGKPAQSPNTNSNPGGGYGY